MNSKILERSMFQAKNKPGKADSGIMQGFDDEPEDIEENDDELMDDVARRSPNSPEILMNNLRGDMRSVDARYQELAEMIGEEAAMETPPEVLAMLQPQFMAQQAPAGISALPTQGVPPPAPPPGAAPMPTPPEMPPQMPQGEMPQGQMPMDQGAMMPPPQNFAFGGEAVAENDGFDPKYYLGRYRDVAKNNMYGGNPLGHYNEYGRNEKRFANAAQENAFNEARRNQIGAEAYRKEVLANPKSYGGINPAYAQEFASSFVAQAPGAQQAPQNRPTFVDSPAYTNQQPRLMANGGIASLPQSGANFSGGVEYNGPLESGATYVQGAGRYGDTMAAHMSPEQHQLLSMMGGGSTTNPKTGLPEHYMGAQFATNLMQRIQPYAQAANQMIGSRMAPVLTPPTIQQGRSTMGTFLPKSVEGMELTYPSLTQRIGMVTQPVRNYVSNMPAVQKAGAALLTVPGGAAVMNAMGGPKETVPAMPLRNDGSDVPGLIGMDEAGARTYDLGPVPPKVEAPKVKPAATAAAEKVDDQLIAPTQPATVDALIDRQTKQPMTNRLDAYMKENLPVFEKYMGGNKEDMQTQALFLLADAGLEYATKPGRTGAIALANAFKRLPAGLGQLAAQESARKAQISGAALTSGLQTLAAEDKAEALLRREILKSAASKGEIIPTELGAGLTSYRGKQGDNRGMSIDPKVTDSFLQSRYTPQVVKGEKGEVVGLNTPYAIVSGGTSQTLNTDKGTRERLATEIGRQESALASIDSALTDYTKAFGPGAFITNFKNNTLVPVVPFLNPDVIAEKKRAQILGAFNTAAKAIARTGDTGNIAVAEQAAAASILGDKPGTFFSDPETALARIMTVRTSLANQRLATAQQLGWVNQDIQLEVPNLGTKNDPIPTDKLSYVSNLAKDNPTGQVYIMTPKGVQQVLLSTLKQ